MFSDGDRYERFMGRWSRELAPLFVRFATVRDGDRPRTLRELGALWRDHGLQNVSEEALTIRIRFASFDDYWLPFLEGQGPAGVYVATLSAGEREQLRARIHKRLPGERPHGAIELRGRAWAVRGTVK